MEGNIFEQASRSKTRFAYKGSITTEDLWDLSVQELDRIFKGLNAKLKVCKEESLLGPKGSENTELDIQVAIVRRVVEVKLAEAVTREMEAEKKAKRERILGILAEKQDASMKGMLEEDLKKMLETL